MQGQTNWAGAVMNYSGPRLCAVRSLLVQRGECVGGVHNGLIDALLVQRYLYDILTDKEVGGVVVDQLNEVDRLVVALGTPDALLLVVNEIQILLAVRDRVSLLGRGYEYLLTLCVLDGLGRAGIGNYILARPKVDRVQNDRIGEGGQRIDRNDVEGYKEELIDEFRAADTLVPILDVVRQTERANARREKQRCDQHDGGEFDSSFHSLS